MLLRLITRMNYTNLIVISKSLIIWALVFSSTAQPEVA